MRRDQTTRPTGARPTLGVIRSQPTRAWGAGVVLDPEEADRRTPPSSTTQPWNHTAPEPDDLTLCVEWISDSIQRWRRESATLERAAAETRRRAIWRAEHTVHLAERDYARVRPHVTKSETRARYEQCIADARSALAAVTAQDDWTPAAASRLPTPAALNTTVGDGTFIHPREQGDTFTIALMGVEGGEAVMVGEVIASDPLFAAEITVAVSRACDAYAARRERARRGTLTLC